MNTATQILKKWQKVDVLQAAQDAINEKSVYGEDAQRKQLFQGLDRDENRITNLVTGSPDYAPRTVEIKSAKGQPTNRITLKDTSDYYSGMKLEAAGEKYRIYSVDEKADLLDVTYSPLGLGMTARIEWLKQLKPEFLKTIKGQMK